MIIVKRILFLMVTFCFVLTPALAQNWNYVLDNYQDVQDRKVIKTYLNAFQKDLKKSWSTPVYSTINSRAVIFYLNKDGNVSDIRILKSDSWFSDSTRYEEYLYNFIRETKFKPFPKEIKEDKIKMGYVFTGTYGSLGFTTAATVYDWSKKVFKDEAQYDSKSE